MPCILALDQGTTSSRALVFSEVGEILSSAQQEITQHFPHEGWVEHNPDEIWTSQLAVARNAIADAKISAADIGAIGITNQRETTVVWERRTGRPIYNAIVWQDRRTAQRCDQLRSTGIEVDFQAKAGLLLDPYFSGTKLQWLLDKVPGARAKAEAGELAFGTIDSWLIWRLTNGASHITDASNASRTLLFNLRTGDWDDTLLTALQIPRSTLPTIVDSSGVATETASEWFGGSIPIGGIAGDQQAALFGHGCTAPGSAKNTYGTGCFLLMNIGERPILSQHRLLTSVAWSIEGRTSYVIEGSVFTGGAVVQWLRDGLRIIKSAEETEALAGQVADTGGVVLVPALTGLGAPYWDPYARGIIVGITRATSAAHIARAALESIAQQSADVIEAMVSDTRASLQSLHVDGGATRNGLLMQIQADLLGVPVVRAPIVEMTAYGAARLASRGIGQPWDRHDQSSQCAGSVFSPAINITQAHAARVLWRRAVERARDWVLPQP
jgi:glycerol kinase